MAARIVRNSEISISPIKVLLLFCAIFLSGALIPLRGQSVPPLILGATHFSPEQLRSIVGSATPDSAIRLLRTAYAADGYLDGDASRNGDTIRVVEGKRYRVARLRVVPDSLVGTVPEIRDEVEGEFFSTEKVLEFLGESVRALNQRGYALASASADLPEVNRDSGSVILSVHIRPGDLITISEIKVAGVGETSKKLVLRAVNIPENALFTDDLARTVRERLTRLQVFGDVADPEIYVVDSGRYGMMITVKEGGTNTFDGVIGYQPATEAQKNGYFTGLVRVVLRNLFGAGERIAGRWERQTETTSELELGYGQPFIFGFPLDVEVGFRQVQEAETPALTSYVQRFLKLDLFYSVTDNWSVRLGGSFDNTIPGPDTLLGPCSPRRLLSSSTLGATLGIRFDTRSNPINPSGGIFYSTSYTFGSKSLNDPNGCLESTLPLSDSRRLLQADVESYIRVVGPLVLAGIANFSEVGGDNLEENELWRFGGASTVRGYRDGLIRASRIAWGRAEGRVLLSSVSHASLFFDGGYYLREADARRGIEGIEDGIYGYGVGLQVDTPVGIARFSFALGRGDTFDQGKVSVGLVGEF